MISPADVMSLSATADEHRFFSKVQVGAFGCWNWTASRTKHGYGHFRLAGATRRAHRVLYQWMFGEELCKGRELDHLCRNKSCVNPFHLEPVTHAENVRRGWIARKKQ